jgi:hypothetical protein
MDYGMFTSEGNVAVSGIVEYAKMHNLSWATVYQNLKDLAKFDYDKYGEATDTMVRELVYDAIGASERGEEFYIWA